MDKIYLCIWCVYKVWWRHNLYGYKYQRQSEEESRNMIEGSFCKAIHCDLIIHSPPDTLINQHINQWLELISCLTIDPVLKASISELYAEQPCDGIIGYPCEISDANVQPSCHLSYKVIESVSNVDISSLSRLISICCLALQHCVYY